MFIKKVIALCLLFCFQMADCAQAPDYWVLRIGSAPHSGKDMRPTSGIPYIDSSHELFNEEVYDSVLLAAEITSAHVFHIARGVDHDPLPVGKPWYNWVDYDMNQSGVGLAGKLGLQTNLGTQRAGVFDLMITDRSVAKFFLQKVSQETFPIWLAASLKVNGKLIFTDTNLP